MYSPFSFTSRGGARLGTVPTSPFSTSSKLYLEPVKGKKVDKQLLVALNTSEIIKKIYFALCIIYKVVYVMVLAFWFRKTTLLSY